MVMAAAVAVTIEELRNDLAAVVAVVVVTIIGIHHLPTHPKRTESDLAFFLNCCNNASCLFDFLVVCLFLCLFLYRLIRVNRCQYRWMSINKTQTIWLQKGSNQYYLFTLARLSIDRATYVWQRVVKHKVTMYLVVPVDEAT